MSTLTFRYAGPSGTGPRELRFGPGGPAGPGVPTGGATGQSLVKASGADFDAEWADQAGGEWGGITGNLSDQDDLQEALNADLLTGLGAYYRLNGNLTDSSGSGRHLTGTGTETYAAAVLGSGLATNGSTTGGLVWQPGTLLDTSLSISAWVFGANGTSVSVTRSGAALGWGQFQLVYVARLTSAYGVRLGIVGHSEATSALASLTAGAWNHVVATWDHASQTRTIWVNGVQLHQAVIADAGGAALTGFVVNATGQFASPLDEPGFWTRVITPAEVALLYKGGAAHDPTYGPPAEWGRVAGTLANQTDLAAALAAKLAASANLSDLASAPTARTNLGLDITAANVYWDPPTAKTLVLTAKAAFAFTLTQIRGLKTSAGTLTLSVKVNGTDVTGLAGLSVSSAAQDAAATAANTVAVGDRVTVAVSGVSSAADLEFTLKATR